MHGPLRLAFANCVHALFCKIFFENNKVYSKVYSVSSMSEHDNCLGSELRTDVTQR